MLVICVCQSISLISPLARARLRFLALSLSAFFAHPLFPCVSLSSPALAEGVAHTHYAHDRLTRLLKSKIEAELARYPGPGLYTHIHMQIHIHTSIWGLGLSIHTHKHTYTYIHIHIHMQVHVHNPYIYLGPGRYNTERHTGEGFRVAKRQGGPDGPGQDQYGVREPWAPPPSVGAGVFTGSAAAGGGRGGVGGGDQALLPKRHARFLERFNAAKEASLAGEGGTLCREQTTFR